MIHEANGAWFNGASLAAQKYGPPDVGMAETISAMPRATNMATRPLEESIRRGKGLTEEADDDPSYRHDPGASSVQAIAEEATDNMIRRFSTPGKARDGRHTW